MHPLTFSFVSARCPSPSRLRPHRRRPVAAPALHLSQISPEHGYSHSSVARHPIRLCLAWLQSVSRCSDFLFTPWPGSSLLRRQAGCMHVPWWQTPGHACMNMYLISSWAGRQTFLLASHTSAPAQAPRKNLALCCVCVSMHLCLSLFLSVFLSISRSVFLCR